MIKSKSTTGNTTNLNDNHPLTKKSMKYHTD